MRTILLYSLLVGVPTLGLLAIICFCHSSEMAVIAVRDVPAVTQIQLPSGSFLLLAQLVVILLLARSVGALFRFIHQPRVVGDMVAGILLGPSLFGWVAPHASAFLFPATGLGSLKSLSEIGLLLYMFLVGLHLDLQKLALHRHVFLLTSHTSIVFPFTLGVLLARYHYPGLAGQRATFTQFALFLGTAMSVTAFPVLARILADLKFLQTRVGSVAIACAAVDDVTAWCILAGIVVFVRTGTVTASFWTTLLGTAAYVVLMISLVRRAVRKIELAWLIQGKLSSNLLAPIVLLVVASGCITETLGIHALFGGFLMGAIMPRNPQFVRAISDKLEGITVALFLPLFFALIGLRSSITLVAGGKMWFYCGIIIVSAIAGKLGGAALSARINGMSWREASTIGLLMNTRGLMELVVLNIGLDIGVISPALFTMLVLMALISTFSATPLIKCLLPPYSPLELSLRHQSPVHSESLHAQRLSGDYFGR